MVADSVVRLSAKEGVFQARHRRHRRYAIGLVIAAAVVTALLWIPVAFPYPGGPALEDPAYAALLILTPLVFWSLAAVAVRGTQTEVRFFADEEEFQPDRLRKPVRSLSANLASSLLHGVRRVRYDEVGRAWHESVWDDPESASGVYGRWSIVMYLRDGSEAWVHDSPEIPEEAYRFLLGQLQRRNIPLEADE